MTHRVWRTAMAALLGLSLLACSNEEDAANTDTGTEAEMAAEAPRPAPVPEEFAFLRYAVNGESTTPELCLTFSEPLSPDTDYSAYVDIDARIALRVDGARLCLGGLSYGDEKELTLRAGFPSADGDTLERDESLTLTFDDRPAVVAFAGSGVILPRIDADGLALTTVNVDEVEIKVSRVTDRALVFRSISEGYSAGEGEYGYGGDEPYELGTEVWKGRIDTAGPTNSTVTSVFPIAEAVGELEPGAYYVEIKDAGALDRDVNRPAEAARWVLVTDLAFTAYRGKDGLNVTVRSLQSAEPVSGVEVQLVARSNEILGTKKTNGSGQVDFSAAMMAGDEGNTPSMLMAYGREGDFALLDLNRTPVDLSNEPVSGRYRPDMADAFLYLDRGIYRPGETVQASLLLRDAAGHAVEDRAGALVLYQPNGIEQARVRFEELANAGGLSQPFALPKAAARGIWRIAVELDGAGTVGSTSFSVEDFIPQRIALELEADTETPMRSGETRLTRLFAFSSLVGREITLDLTQECLADILRASDKKITVEEIQRKVAEHYNIRMSDLIGPKRVRSFARPRQVAMYLAKTLTSRSLPEIGRRFGGRDHTTVIHGVKKVEELKVQDSQIAEDIELLRRALEA